MVANRLRNSQRRRRPRGGISSKKVAAIALTGSREDGNLPQGKKTLKNTLPVLPLKKTIKDVQQHHKQNIDIKALKRSIQKLKANANNLSVFTQVMNDEILCYVEEKDKVAVLQMFCRTIGIERKHLYGNLYKKAPQRMRLIRKNWTVGTVVEWVMMTYISLNYFHPDLLDAINKGDFRIIYPRINARPSESTGALITGLITGAITHRVANQMPFTDKFIKHMQGVSSHTKKTRAGSGICGLCKKSYGTRCKETDRCPHCNRWQKWGDCHAKPMKYPLTGAPFSSTDQTKWDRCKNQINLKILMTEDMDELHSFCGIKVVTTDKGLQDNDTDNDTYVIDSNKIDDVLADRTYTTARDVCYALHQSEFEFKNWSTKVKNDTYDDVHKERVQLMKVPRSLLANNNERYNELAYTTVKTPEFVTYLRRVPDNVPNPVRYFAVVCIAMQCDCRAIRFLPETALLLFDEVPIDLQISIVDYWLTIIRTQVKSSPEKLNDIIDDNQTNVLMNNYARLHAPTGVAACCCNDAVDANTSRHLICLECVKASPSSLKVLWNSKFYKTHPIWYEYLVQNAILHSNRLHILQYTLPPLRVIHETHDKKSDANKHTTDNDENRERQDMAKEDRAKEDTDNAYIQFADTVARVHSRSIQLKPTRGSPELPRILRLRNVDLSPSMNLSQVGYIFQEGHLSQCKQYQVVHQDHKSSLLAATVPLHKPCNYAHRDDAPDDHSGILRSGNLWYDNIEQCWCRKSFHTITWKMYDIFTHSIARQAVTDGVVTIKGAYTYGKDKIEGMAILYDEKSNMASPTSEHWGDLTLHRFLRNARRLASTAKQLVDNDLARGIFNESQTGFELLSTSIKLCTRACSITASTQDVKKYKVQQEVECKDFFSGVVTKITPETGLLEIKGEEYNVPVLIQSESSKPWGGAVEKQPVEKIIARVLRRTLIDLRTQSLKTRLISDIRNSISAIGEMISNELDSQEEAPDAAELGIQFFLFATPVYKFGLLIKDLRTPQYLEQLSIEDVGAIQLWEESKLKCYQHYANSSQWTSEVDDDHQTRVLEVYEVISYAVPHRSEIDIRYMNTQTMFTDAQKDPLVRSKLNLLLAEYDVCHKCRHCFCSNT